MPAAVTRSQGAVELLSQQWQLAVCDPKRLLDLVRPHCCWTDRQLGSIPLQANGAPTRERLPALRYPSAPSQRAQRGLEDRPAVEAAAAAGH